MGEYADYAIDEALNADEYYLNNPDIAEEEGYWSYFGRRTGPRPKTCSICHTSNLYWGHTKDGWRLFEGEAKHTCKMKKFGARAGR